MSVQTIPPTFYQVAFNADPNQNTLPPYWTDVSSRVQFGWSTGRGRHYEIDVNETGTWRPPLANPDGALDPTNTSSPYAPGVVPYRQARIRCLPGPNLLTADQATAGEGTGYGPGTVPPQTNVTCGAGYPLAYAISGSAYQGTQVYQVAVPNGAAAPKDLLTLSLVPALPGTAYAVQVQARLLATAQILAVNLAVDWLNSAGTAIPAPQVAQQPLALGADGTFETGVANWFPAAGTIAQSSTRAHTGTYSGLLTVVGTPSQTYVRPPGSAVVPNTPYVATMWVAAAVGTPNAQAAIDWRDSGGSYISTSSGTIQATSGVWAQLSVSGTSPPTAAFAAVGPTMPGSPATGNAIYVDDVTLTQPVAATTTTGPGVALTGGSSMWAQLTAAGTAPPGTTYCRVRAVLGTATTAAASAQFDGVQFEANPFPTPFQVPNTVSANLLPRPVATGGLASAAVTGSWFPSAGTVAYTTGLLAAPTGHTNAAAWTTPAGTTSSSPLLLGGAAAGPAADTVQVTAATAYTFSCYGLRAASADVTLAVTPSITWYTASGAVVSTSTGGAVTLATGAWVRPTVTATAPAGAAWGRPSLAVTTPATTTVTNTVYVTGCQVEAAGAASTWQDPGTAYAVITPFIERWPQGWNQLNSTYGTSDVVGVDAFAALSQYTLPTPYVAELLALNPNFLYQLNDPLGSTACADTTGKRIPAPVETSPFGAGSVVFGNPVVATTVPSGGFLGTPGPVATFGNNSNGSSPSQYNETFVSIHKTTAKPGPPAAGPWTRLIAFRASTTPPAGTSDYYTMWWAQGPSYASSGALLRMAITFGGTLRCEFVDPNAGAIDITSGSSVCDGNWHLAAIGVSTGSGQAKVWLDGVQIGFVASGVGAAGVCVSDIIGANITLGNNLYWQGMVGDVAHAVEFPSFLSNAQILSLYNSWRSASSGESSGARVNRVLKWINWQGPVAIDSGSTTSMGPATDLTGATALDALNNIALTENGTLFVSSAGVLTFKARGARYGQAVPVYTFGENAAAGEWPYEFLHFENDPSHIASDVQVVQYGGATSTAFDAASRKRTFPRTYQRTVNASSLAECADAAAYLLSVMKVARQRVDVLRLHPSAVPGLFAVCLNLELGTRIRVNRRPQNGPPIVFDGFVEKIEWLWQADTNDVYVTLQCSPALKYWVLAALHTTLSAQANSGTNTISINALPDAAVNKLAQSLPSGYQLTLDPGTAVAETVTIAPGGIPSTSLGYATATLTLTANLVNTHSSGAVVCEALPAGVTDPTVFDTQSILGAATTTFASAATAGTNTISINALPDAKTNALASSVPQSWQIWLSPGTPNFETATVAPTGVPVTYPGWTTAVLTLTANLVNNHAAGDIICDPLPAGVTNPSAVPATTVPAY